MKSSDPLLLADGTLHCGMYPAGKFAISRHLAQCDHTVGKLSAVTGSMCSEVILKFQPPVCLDYRARNAPQHIFSENDGGQYNQEKKPKFGSPISTMVWTGSKKNHWR